MVHGQHRTSFSIGAACLLLLIACCTATAAAAQHISPVKSFFKDVDVDGDGQLQQHELQHFVGSRIQGSEAQTKQQIKEAALQSIVRLDGNDAGSTISEAELESFLHTVLKVCNRCTPSSA
jgi:Ca2+-binding EF-hand superfamily protein